MSVLKQKELLCPHLDECKQKVRKDSFESLCFGKDVAEIGWHQKDCFKFNDLEDSVFSRTFFGEEGHCKNVKIPKEWKEA